MDPNIKQTVHRMLMANPKDYLMEYFENLELTEDDLQKINTIPGGVDDVALLAHCSPTFSDSLKEFIDTHSCEDVKYALDEIINNVGIDPYPINPNNHEFATVSEKNIIRYRLKKVIESKFY